MSRMNLSIVLSLFVASLAASARAQERKDDAPPALTGPAVTIEHAPSLVAYVYGGKLRELDLPPAEAALELIDLDEYTSELVADVLARRAQLAEDLVIANFDFLSQAETVEASGNKLQQAGFFLKAIHIFYPLIERGQLEDEIRPVLPDETRREYDRVLNEYWEAFARTQLEGDEQRVTRQKIRREVRKARRDQVGKEIELAAERALQSERFAVGYLLRELDLTEAQQTRVDQLVTDFVARTMGDATEDQVGAVFAQIIAFLNEEQREVLAKRIQGL